MNIFKSFFGLSRERTSPPVFDPTSDWLVLLISGTLILAGIIVWNVWAFDTVAKGDALGLSVAKTEPVFSQASLDTIRAVFMDRAFEEAKYVSGVYVFTDPSQ